jgi:perosamine synthetase
MRIPWTAVGETASPEDLATLVRFLLPPAAGHQAEYEAAAARLEAALAELAAHATAPAQLTLGPHVRRLEAEARRLFGVRHACFLTNATAGLEIAHQLIGLQPGDEVIVPPLTFIATMAYPLGVGAKVVFADVDPHTLNLDPADVERKLTPRTRAVIPVHLGGWPVAMAPLMELSRRHGFYVIEDAAHAIGGRYQGRPLGTIGHFGAFSFHQVKNITSFGEGGLLLSNEAVAAQFPQARYLGIDPARQAAGWIYDVTGVTSLRGHAVQPGNHSATEIAALGLLCQLERLPAILARRRAMAARLTRRLGGVPGLRPQRLDTADCQGTFMVYQIQVEPDVLGQDVQALKRKLTARGIAQIPQYVPLYHYEILRRLGYDAAAAAAACPVAEEAYRHRFTHLPLGGLTDAQLDTMAEAVLDAVAEMKAGR